MTRNNLALLLALLIGSIALAACGDLESESSEGAERGELTENTTTRAGGNNNGNANGGNNNNRQVDLPPLRSGQITIQGEIDGSLAPEIIDDFAVVAARNNLAATVVAVNNDEETGFEALCAGEIDLVSASRRITEAELAACESVGLEVVDYKIAFDAIVLATKNETDLGVDCINLAQARAIFQAGSPIRSWNQLNPNFVLNRISTTGPVPDSSDFDFFGARVLGVPNPTLANFRSDYRPFADEERVQQFISGRVDGDRFRESIKVVNKFERRLDASRRRLVVANQELKISTRKLKRSGKRLDEAVEAQRQKVVQRREVKHRRLEIRQAQASRNQRLASRNLKKLSRQFDDAVAERDGLDRTVPGGAIGIIGFSAYEVFEEKLRPLEIDGQTGNRCVFPSDETISSESYPLERTIRLYTTTRSLRRAEIREYLEYHITQAGEIASSADFIPLPEDVELLEIARISDPTLSTAATQDDAGSAPAGTDAETGDGTSEDDSTDSSDDSTDANSGNSDDDSTDETTSETTNDGG